METIDEASTEASYFTMTKVPLGPLFGASSIELRRLCGAAELQREEQWEVTVVIQSWMDFNEDPIEILELVGDSGCVERFNGISMGF